MAGGLGEWRPCKPPGMDVGTFLEELIQAFSPLPPPARDRSESAPLARRSRWAKVAVQKPFEFGS